MNPLPDGLTSLYSETFPTGMHRRNRQLAEAGVEVLILIVRGDYEGNWMTTWFWRGDGIFADERDRDDGLELNRQAAEVLAINPEARFMVRWSAGVPEAWAAEHPDHLQASSTIRLERASYASQLAAAGRAEQARRIVHYVEAQPWGDRVIGYLPFGQDEGTHDLSLSHGMFDQAPVMQEAFRAFTGDPRITVPTDEEWAVDRAGWLHWPEPVALTRYQAYFRCVRHWHIEQRRSEMAAVREAASKPTLIATDTGKVPMFGWLHNDAFEAKNTSLAWRNVLLASGCFDVADLLDLPELDALITPADYTARSVGFGYEGEGIGDSLVLRGKTLFIEDDARSWATDEGATQGAWRTPAEAKAGLDRNLAIGASRGLVPYWMNVGRGYFDDPEVLRICADQLPLRQRLLSLGSSHTEHAIAMIIDDESPLDEDFTTGFQHLAVLQQRNFHLSMTGLPWRIHLLSDLRRDNVPAYRCYLLPNLFRLTEEKEDLIRRQLMQAGRLIIYGPGTAISDGTTLSAAGASRLLGMPMELVHKESARQVLVYGGAQPAIAGVQPGLTYGDSFAYGPILQPEIDHGGIELGKVSAWWHCNRPGLVLKQHDDCTVVFSMATPLPAALLRSLALHAGCTPWSQLGDVVAANDEMVAIHTTTPGPRTIRLPRPADIIDASHGGTIATATDRFQVELKAPDTRAFLLR